jgi:hypothetical protein
LIEAILPFCKKLPICSSGEGESENDNLMSVLSSHPNIYDCRQLVGRLLKRAALHSKKLPSLCYDSELENNFVFAYLKALKMGGIKPGPKILFLDIYGRIDKKLALAFGDAVRNISSLRGVEIQLSSWTGLENFKMMLESIKENKKIYKIKFKVDESSLQDIEKLIGNTFENIQEIKRTDKPTEDRHTILCILKKTSSSPQTTSDSLPKTKTKHTRSKQRCT